MIDRAISYFGLHNISGYIVLRTIQGTPIKRRERHHGELHFGVSLLPRLGLFILPPLQNNYSRRATTPQHLLLRLSTAPRSAPKSSTRQTDRHAIQTLQRPAGAEWGNNILSISHRNETKLTTKRKEKRNVNMHSNKRKTKQKQQSCTAQCRTKRDGTRNVT